MSRSNVLDFGDALKAIDEIRKNINNQSKIDQQRINQAQEANDHAQHELTASDMNSITNALRIADIPVLVNTEFKVHFSSSYTGSTTSGSMEFDNGVTGIFKAKLIGSNWTIINVDITIKGGKVDKK